MTIRCQTINHRHIGLLLLASSFLLFIGLSILLSNTAYAITYSTAAGLPPADDNDGGNGGGGGSTGGGSGNAGGGGGSTGGGGGSAGGGNGNGGLNLPNIIRTCLPEEGRMFPNSENHPCHCPPDSYCPQNLNEWTTHPRMPGSQALICCPPPDECHVLQSELLTVCPGQPNRFDFEFAPRCTNFKATYDENPAVLAQNQQAANTATNCAQNCMAAHFPANPSSWPIDEEQWRTLDDCLEDCHPASCNNSLNVCFPDECNVECDAGGFMSFALCRQQIYRTNCPTPSSSRSQGDDDGDCLPADMLITMEDGTTKPILELKAGDQVQGEYAVNIVAEVVTKRWDTLILYSINDGALQLTKDHLVMTLSGWKAVEYDPALARNTEYVYGLKNVKPLVVGDRIITDNGVIEVQSLEPTLPQSNFTTYNLKLDGNKTFYANGVLVRGL